MITRALLLLQAAMPNSTIATRVESMLSRSAVPIEGEVAVITTASADTVFVGDQVEVMTVAWFPSAVRERLRRPPTLRPPSLNGVWSLPVVTLPGVAAHRMVGETGYDLYASHQVVFPVTPGRLTIPAADLAYSSPASRQFFGDERREDRRSRERTVTVLPLPTSRRPMGFGGPVARGLQVRWRIASPNARVGELLAVDILLTGEGNLALWGPPSVDWPAGVRAYPDRDTELPAWRGARLAGTRQFRYLLLPDSAGSVTLPSIQYTFFDPLQRSYRTADAAAVLIPILPPVTPGEVRSPPALLPEAAEAWPRRLVDDSDLGLVAGVLLPPLLALLALLSRRRSATTPPTPGAQALGRFELVLSRLAGASARRRQVRMDEALRRAGIDREEAVKAVELHQRIRALRYARPESRLGSESELAEESARWLARLPSALLRRTLGSVALVVALGGVPGAGAQEPSATTLYLEGAWEAAARAQARRMSSESAPAMAWYNLGAMRWMAHHDAAAAAAWLEALRLAPRDPTVRRGWGELALRHQHVRGWEPALPAAPHELILLGLGFWWAGFGVLVFRWPKRRLALGLLAFALLAIGTGLGTQHTRQRTEAFTVASAPLREAPHGLAASAGTVGGVTLVRIEDRDGGWLRIRDPLGRSGWLPASALALVRGLD